MDDRGGGIRAAGTAKRERGRHVGIVGVSAEGAALCYRTFCAEGAELFGRHAHPEVSLHTIPLSRYMERFDAGDWQGVAELMLTSAEKLAAVGAELLICPDNTVHQVFDRVVHRSPLPWLHIADEVAAAASRAGLRRLALLGTRYLMEGPVYPPRLAAAGIEHRTPTVPDRERIDAVIFDHLVYGHLREQDRRAFREIIAGLAGDGCDGVILGCTEIPLLITPEDSPLPVLDSTRLLARAALRQAASPA